MPNQHENQPATGPGQTPGPTPRTHPPLHRDSDELTALAEELLLSPDDLDDVVHQAASRQASAVNNQGLPGQIRFLLEQFGPDGTRSIVEGIGLSHPMAAVAELRGRMVDGYDDRSVNAVLGCVSDASGLQLVCVWEYFDGMVGGNSQFYILEDDGRLRELAGDLWRWLNSDPAEPDAPSSCGAPDTWHGELTDLTEDAMKYSDGFRNYALSCES